MTRVGGGPFVVGLSHDLAPLADLAASGLDELLQESGVACRFFRASDTLTPEDFAGCHAVVLLGPRVTADSLSQADRLLLIARWGVGYDNVDVEACSAAGIALTITTDAVRRPVAHGTMALLLAVAHRVVEKDRIARTGEWPNRFRTLGTSLTGRTLGVVGLGNIGRELVSLARPFGLRIVAADPNVSREQAEGLGARLANLDELLSESDFVVLTLALTPETHHLIDAQRLRRMRSDATLINVSRGAIVDSQALADALRAGVIRAAALDTLQVEPPRPDDPLLGLNDVLLTPHSIAWTDELVRRNTSLCIRAVLDVMHGSVPAGIVNRAVMESETWKAKLAARAGGPSTGSGGAVSVPLG